MSLIKKAKARKPTKSSDIDNIKDLKISNEENEEDDEEQESYVNKFNFLEDEENKFEINEDEDNDVEVAKPSKPTKNKSKKKKGKKEISNDFKFITDSSDNPLFIENNSESTIKTSYSDEFEEIQVKKYNRSLLQIEAKYLNSENEMIRMFGAKVVNAEKANQNNRLAGSKRALLSKLTKFNTIVNKRSTWPEFVKNGLQMKQNLINGDEIEFSFEHLKEYQSVQFNFLDAVESLDHNNIFLVLHHSPFHIDSLIQLSDVSRISDDTQMAADLIERALYAYQNTFHPSFNLQKNNFKLDYCRVENRGFFICLFKHLLYTGAKACYRTSLELCKLILSLDLSNDPLGVILMIDFYALRSRQYKYFIDFYCYFNPIKHLSLLPNMQYSIALAYFHLYEDTRNIEHLNEANRQLKEALLKFPGLLLELLDKCAIQPDKDVEKHDFFAKHNHLNTPQGLKCLFNLYAIRMNSEWKIPEVVVWLEKNVKLILDESKNLNKSINDYKNKFKTLFAKIPPNVLRHITLSDSKEMALNLPPEFASKASYTFDPIPPVNSIVSYKRPDRPRTVATYANEASLLTFFRSLLPSFNSEERVTEETLAAGGGGGGGRLGLNPTDIMAQLREFFVNLQPPLENVANDVDNDIHESDIEEGHEFD